MTFGIKNLTVNDIELSESGITVWGNSTRTLTKTDLNRIAGSAEVIAAINTDQIILVKNVDTNTNFSKSDSIALLNRNALNIPLIYGTAGILSLTKLWLGSAAVEADGSWSVDISSAGFTSITSLNVIGAEDTSDINEIPSVSVKTVTTTTITGWAVESKLTAVLLGGNVEGLEFGDTGTTVYVQVWGA